MREASEAVTAAKAFTSNVSNGHGADDPVRTSIFKVAMDEANDKANKLTIKYLAAVEARRAFEALLELKTIT